MIIGWQTSEPQLSSLATGTYIYTAALDAGSSPILAQGPDLRIYVGSGQDPAGTVDGALRVHRVEEDGSWTSYGIAMEAEETWSDALLAVGPDGAPVIAVAINWEGWESWDTVVKRWIDSGTGDGTWVTVTTIEDFRAAGLVVPEDGRSLLAGTLQIVPPPEPELLAFREPTDGGEWSDIGRPALGDGDRRETIALTLVGGEAVLVYREYATTPSYSYSVMHSRWRAGRGWDPGQSLMGLGSNGGSISRGTPLTAQTAGDEVFIHVDQTNPWGPITETYQYVGRWAPR